VPWQIWRATVLLHHNIIRIRFQKFSVQKAQFFLFYERNIDIRMICCRRRYGRTEVRNRKRTSYPYTSCPKCQRFYVHCGGLSSSPCKRVCFRNRKGRKDIPRGDNSIIGVGPEVVGVGGRCVSGQDRDRAGWRLLRDRLNELLGVWPKSNKTHITISRPSVIVSGGSW